MRSALSNPFFYMIDGFRYGFIGHADGSIWVGAAVMLAVDLALLALCHALVDARLQAQGVSFGRHPNRCALTGAKTPPHTPRLSRGGGPVGQAGGMERIMQRDNRWLERKRRAAPRHDDDRRSVYRTPIPLSLFAQESLRDSSRFADLCSGLISSFERGEGAYLYTGDGRKYLDFASGVAVTALGHRHPHLVERPDRAGAEALALLQPVPDRGPGDASPSA